MSKNSEIYIETQPSIELSENKNSLPLEKSVYEMSYEEYTLLVEVRL